MLSLITTCLTVLEYLCDMCKSLFILSIVTVLHKILISVFIQSALCFINFYNLSNLILSIVIVIFLIAYVPIYVIASNVAYSDTIASPVTDSSFVMFSSGAISSKLISCFGNTILNSSIILNYSLFIIIKCSYSTVLIVNHSILS